MDNIIYKRLKKYRSFIIMGVFIMAFSMLMSDNSIVLNQNEVMEDSNDVQKNITVEKDQINDLDLDSESDLDVLQPKASQYDINPSNYASITTVEGNNRVLSGGTYNGASDIALSVNGMVAGTIPNGGYLILRNITINGAAGYHALLIAESSNVIVEGCTIVGGMHGIAITPITLKGQGNITIRFNTVRNAQEFGIRFHYVHGTVPHSNVQVYGNTVYSNKYGISLKGVAPVTCYSNKVYSNTQVGIWLRAYVRSPTVYNNYIYGNPIGILIKALSDTPTNENYPTSTAYTDSYNIYNNYIMDNTNYGIYSDGNNDGPRGTNYIRYNTFTGNGQHAYITQTLGSITIDQNFWEGNVLPQSGGYLTGGYTINGNIQRTDANAKISPYTPFPVGAFFVTVPQIHPTYLPATKTLYKANEYIQWESSTYYTATQGIGTISSYTLQYSANGGGSWTTIYSGTSTSYTWDTTTVADGTDYRLRVYATTSDSKTKYWTGTTSFTVHNSLTAPTISAPVTGDVVHFPFDNNQKDISKSGITLIGTNTKFVTGQFGSALNFDATADDLYATNTAALQIKDKMSWSAWVYPTTTSYVDSGAFIWKNNEYGLRMSNGGYFQAYLYSSTGWEPCVQSPTAYTANNWYYVMGVRDGSELSLYVNGIKVGSRSGISGVAATTNALYIGDQAGGNDFLGYIDDVRITNGCNEIVYHVSGAGTQVSWSAATNTVGATVSYIPYYSANGGYTWISLGGTSNTYQNFDTRTVNDGDTFALKVVAIDSLGINSTSATAVFRIQNDPIAVAVQPSYSVGKGKDLTIQWIIYDYSVSSGTYSIYRESTIVQTGPWSGNGTVISHAVNTYLETETYTFSIRVNDGQKAMDKNTTRTQTIAVIIENNLPVFMTNPNNVTQDYGYTGTSMQWSFYDDSLTTGHAYSIWVTDLREIPIYPVTCVVKGTLILGTQYVSYTIPNTQLPGNYSIEVRVNDGFGTNVSSELRSFRINNIYPDIQLNGKPDPPSQVEGTYGTLLYWKIMDVSYYGTRTYSILRDSTIVATGTWSHNSEFSYMIPLELPAGTYTYTVNAWDGFNNQTGGARTVIRTANLNPQYSVLITRSQPQPYGTSGTEIRWTLTDATMNGSARYEVWRDETVDVMVKSGVWNTTGDVVNYVIATNTIVGEYDYYIIICDGFNLLNHNTTSSNSHIYIENNIPTFGYSQGLFYRFGNLNEKSVNFTITDDGSWTSERRYTILMKNNSAGGATTIVQTGYWNTGSQIKYILPYFSMVTGSIENEDVDNYDYFMRVTDGFDQPLYYANQTTDMIRVSICRFDAPIINYSTSPFSIQFGLTQKIEWQVNGTDIKPVPTGTTGNYSLFHKELTGMFVLIRVGTWQDGSIIDYNLPTDLVVGEHRYRLEITSGYLNVTHDIYVTILNNLPGSSVTSPYSTFVFGYSQSDKNVTWVLTDDNSYLGYPATTNLKYSILRNGTYVAVGSWTVGTPIVYNIPITLGAELSTNYYNYSILFTDGYDNVTSAAKWISITPNNRPVIVSNPDYSHYYGEFGRVLNWSIADPNTNSSLAYKIIANASTDNTVVATGTWTSGVNITYILPTLLGVGLNTYTLVADDGYTSAIGGIHNTTAAVVNVTIIFNEKATVYMNSSIYRLYAQGVDINLEWKIVDTTINGSRAYSIHVVNGTWGNGTSIVQTGVWNSGENISYAIPQNIFVGNYTYYLNLTDGYTITIGSSHNKTFAGMVAVEIANNLPSFTSHPNSIKQPWDRQNNQFIWGVDDDESLMDPVPQSQTYSVFRNGVRVAVGTWTRASNIIYTIPAYMNRGIYTYTVEINDGFGVNVTSNPRTVEVCNIVYFQVKDNPLSDNTIAGVQLHILLQGNPSGNNASITNASGNATFWDLAVGGYYRVMINHTNAFGKEYLMYNTTGYDVYFGSSTNVLYITYRIVITNIEMKIVQPNGVAQTNATVTFTNIATPSLSYQGITRFTSNVLENHLNGTVTFLNIPWNSGEWRVIVTEWLDGELYTLLNRTMVINTNALVLYPEFFHNLTGVRFTFQDLDNNYVTNTEVTILLNSNPNINWTGMTDGTGQILFKNLYNATWRLTVKGLLFSGIEYTILNTTYTLSTPEFYRAVSISTQCNRTLLTIHTVDSLITNPAFYNIHSAEVKIYTPTDVLLGTYFTVQGYTSVVVPRTTLKFTVSYKGEIKNFKVIAPFESSNGTNQVIDLNNDISTLPTTLMFNVTTMVQMSYAELAGVTFHPTLNATWGTNGGRTVDLSYGLYSVTIFAGDTIYLNANWSAIGETVTPINGGTVTAKIYRGGNLIDVNLPVSAPINGIYSITIDTNTAKFFTGNYLFKFEISGSGYQEGYFDIAITLLNKTAVLERVSTDNQYLYDQGFNTQIRLKTTFPDYYTLDGAILKYSIKSIGRSGIDLTPSGSNGLYMLSISPNDLVEGFYQIEVYGNLTNYGWVSLTFIVQVLPLPAQISAGFESNSTLGGNSLRTSAGENISFYIVYKDGNGNNFTVEQYAQVTFSAFLDGGVNVTQYIYPTAFPGLYYFTMRALGYEGAVRQISVIASLPHYYDQSFLIQADIISEWKTILQITQAPGFYVWGENASFIMKYEANEDPRKGLLLPGAEISGLNITHYVNFVEQEKIFLDINAMNAGLWGRSDLGNGLYLVWFNTSIVDVTEESAFIAKPLISINLYRTATIDGFFYVRPVSTQVIAVEFGKENIPLSSNTMNKNDVIDVIAKLSVSEPGNIFGFAIDGATVIYEMYDDMNVLNRTGVLTPLTGGRYGFELNATDSGFFTIKIIATIVNHTTSTTTFTINVALQTFTIGISIPTDIRLGALEVRASMWENITFTISINNGVENPVLSAYLDFSEGNPRDISGFIYPINSTLYQFTMPANETTIGVHTIRIVASKSLYENTIQTVQVNLISEWGTRTRMVELMGIYIWGEKAYFVLNYYAVEIPRSGKNLPDGIIEELRLYPINNPSQVVILTFAQNGTKWGGIDLSKVGALPGFTGVEKYNDGFYLIWFDTDVLSINGLTEFTVEATIKSYTYTAAIRDTKFNLNTVSTKINGTAYDGRNNTIIDDLPAVNFNIDNPLYLILNWQVSDPINPYYNTPVTGINAVSYTITRQNDSTTTTGMAVSLGNGLYNISLNSTQKGRYFVVVTATLMNYTSTQYTTVYVIGFDQLEFVVYADASVRFGSNLTMKMTRGESYLFYIDISMIGGLEQVNLTILLDNSIPLTYTQVGNLLQVSGSAANLNYGLHEISVKGSKAEFIDRTYLIELQIIDEWGTEVEVVQAPTLYPWSNNITFTIRYYVIEQPKSLSGVTLDAATISSIMLITDLSALNGSFGLQDVILTDYSLGTDWGYTAKGNGEYSIWINSRVVFINKLTSFYLIPTISQSLYRPASATPYVWIDTVDTQLFTSIGVVSGNSTLPYASDRLLTEITLHLDEKQLIYVFYNAVDKESVLNGLNLTQALVTYTVYFKGTTQVLESGAFISAEPGYYRFNLTAWVIGEYTVRITATKTNFQQQIYDFTFNVIPKVFEFELLGILNGTSFESPRNQELMIQFRMELEIEALVEFNGKNYSMNYDPETHIYSFTFLPQMLQQHKENTLHTVIIHLNEVNYTSVNIEYTFRIGYSADKRFGVPYMYWFIIGVTIGTFVAVAAVRRAVYVANIPIELKRIDYAQKLISKKKSVSGKRLMLNRVEEMYRKFGIEWKMLQLDMKKALDLLEMAATGDEELDGLLNEVEGDFKRDDDIIDNLLAEARDRAGKGGYVSLDGSKRPAAGGEESKDFDLDDFLASTVEEEEKKE